MRRTTKAALRGSVLILAIVMLNCVLPNFGFEATKKIHAQIPEQIPPPNESDYVGLTKCAACHYQQYQDWKATSHAKAFDYLPEKYRNDTECLQCHTSRHGRAAAGQASTNEVAGVGCEDCHGPGREHANFALTFVGQETVFTDEAVHTLRSRIAGQEKKLTDESVKKLRSLIQRTAVGQCFKCHTSKAHKPHPEFDRDEAAKGSPQRDTIRRRSFFDVRH